MFRGDVYIVMAAALATIVLVLYLVMRSTPFFPETLFDQYGICPANGRMPAQHGKVIEDFQAQWFGSGLQDLGERPIFQDSGRPQRTVRFYYQRSFEAPLFIRIEDADAGRLRMLAQLSPGPDGCPHYHGCKVNRLLSAAEQARFESMLATVRAQPSFGCLPGIDGSEWVVEVSGHRVYRYWQAWSPMDGPIRDLGLTLIDLTGFRLTEVY